jgi:hypothetical protein
VDDIVPKSDWPMRIAVMPVASGTAGVATIALGLERPAPHDRLTDNVELTIKAFTPEGDARGSFVETVPVVLPPSQPGDASTRYDVLASLPLGAGHYQLRVSAHGTPLDITGSVYADVDVPDFAKAPLSLSGVLVTVAPAPIAAPRLVLSTIVPVVPTSERTFATTDRVATFVRVYQAERAQPQAATITIRLVDAHDQSIASQRLPVRAAAFAGRHSADVTFPIPMSHLTAGEYLLTFEASLGKTTVRRDVRFSVK